MGQEEILKALSRVGELLDWPDSVEILLIGGAAGMITGQLAPDRTTLDCDVMHCSPAEAMQPVEDSAGKVAKEAGLPAGWLSSQPQQLDILPDGWRGRRKLVGKFGRLSVFAVGRSDLLATKFYANRAQDREDILAMKPTRDELAFVRGYLGMLRVPSRNANLDQVRSALRLLEAVEEETDDA